MMQQFNHWIQQFSTFMAQVDQTPFAQGILTFKNFLWDYILLFLLVGIGIYLSVTLKFPQLRYLFPSLKKMLGDIIKKKPSKEGTMTPFQSLATAVASQVGTGNIIGVATAIAAGGPGAGFWMLVSAFFGMATIFSEAVLAQIYRTKIHGETCGGPAYYLKNGLHSRFLSTFFAIFCILGLGIVGVMVQSSAVVQSFHASFGLPRAWVTLALAVIVGIILAGGMGRIAKFSETVVPFMAFAYIFASLVIICMNLGQFLPALLSIVQGAFAPQAIFGGVLGISIRESMRFGIARGLFSNEAGMGSTPHSHATADVNHPVEQGMTSMIGVFICTFLICLSTAMINLVSGAYDPTMPQAELSAFAELMTQTAFGLSFGRIGEGFLTIALSSFALTTIVGWYFFAEANVKFLFGRNKLFVQSFRVISIFFLVLGPTLGGDFIWTLADLFMGLMALPNIIGLALLRKKTTACLNDYIAQSRAGREPLWTPPETIQGMEEIDQ